MSLGLYKDVHVPAAITRTLVLRDVDVLTAQLDGTAKLDDGAQRQTATQALRISNRPNSKGAGWLAL